MENKDKSTNKSDRITVRLTANQYFELEQIAKENNLKKSALLRLLISKFIKDYYGE